MLKRQHHPPTNLDRVCAAEKILRDVAATADPDVGRVDSLDYCIRPMRELSEIDRQQREHYGAAAQPTPYTSPRFCQTEDAAAFHWASEVFLAKVSHRCILRASGLIEYHQEDYDVDCQAVARHPKNLIGRVAIADDIDATKELVNLSEILEGADIRTWQASPSIPIRNC